MQLDEVFAELAAIVRAESDPTRAFRALCALGNRAWPDESLWTRLTESADVEADVAQLQEWALGVLDEEPPPAGLAALWFGLFERYDDQGDVQTTLYLCGTTKYDAGDEAFEWAVDPAWFPDARYAESQVLALISGEVGTLLDEEGDYDDAADLDDEDDATEDLLNEAGVLGEEDEDEEEDDDLLLEDGADDAGGFPLGDFLSWFLPVGYAAIVARRVGMALPPEVFAETRARKLVVGAGHDDGDGLVLGTAHADGAWDPAGE